MPRDFTCLCQKVPRDSAKDLNPAFDILEFMKHEQQQKIWDAEHEKPQVLKQMDSAEGSSGVVKFWDFLKEEGVSSGRGLEMGCGKGRNVIWLAKQGIDAYGFDFSPVAIKEAEKRAQASKLSSATHFSVQDATKEWQYESDFFDFGIDCFATTDIESLEGRQVAIKEMFRVLKPGGYFLAYLLSTDDEFHKGMIENSPTEERNAFLHPSTGKFEKAYDEKDIQDLYGEFGMVKHERVKKTTEFFGKEYGCLHHWIVFRKSQ